VFFVGGVNRDATRTDRQAPSLTEHKLLLLIPGSSDCNEITRVFGKEAISIFGRKRMRTLDFGSVELVCIIPKRGSFPLVALEAAGQPGARHDSLRILGRQLRGQDREVGPPDLEIPDYLDALILWSVHGVTEGAVAGIASQRAGVDACDDARLQGVMGDVVEALAALDPPSSGIALSLGLNGLIFCFVGSFFIVWSCIFIAGGISLLLMVVFVVDLGSVRQCFEVVIFSPVFGHSDGFIIVIKNDMLFGVSFPDASSGS
jgi:hypothetical protein